MLRSCMEYEPSGSCTNEMKSELVLYSEGNVTSMPVSVRMRWLFAILVATLRRTFTRSGRSSFLARST